MKKKSRLSKWWSQLKVSERVALITVLGALLASICGGLFGIVGGLITTQYQTNIQRNPSDNLEALKVAGIRFQDRKTGSIYGIPVNTNLPKFDSGTDWDEKRDFLNSQGYHILYRNADFSTFTWDEDIPSSTVDSSNPFPTFPLEYELWNLDKEFPIVIDEVSLELLDFQQPTTSDLNWYYLVSPQAGGGPDFPRYEFDTSFSPSVKIINLFQESSQRVPIEPRKVILVILNLSFEIPGRYTLRSSIKYHLPDGSSQMIDLEEFVYSWVETDFIDGSKVLIIE